MAAPKVDFDEDDLAMYGVVGIPPRAACCVLWAREIGAALEANAQEYSDDDERAEVRGA